LGINAVTEVSRFLEDLRSYEANRQETDDPRVRQIKGRTARAVVLGLLLFLAGFACTGALLTSRASNGLKHILFAMVFLFAATAHGLRWYYARAGSARQENSKE
jgi:hypothetical protein